MFAKIAELTSAMSSSSLDLGMPASMSGSSGAMKLDANAEN